MAIKDIVDNTFNAVGSNLPGPLAKSKPKEDTRRESCEAQGGVWDAINEVCVRKEQPLKDIQQPERPEVAPALETFTDPRTGRASGITTKSGKTFLGLSPEEVQQVATGEQAREARPEGTAPVGTARAEAEQAQQVQQAIAQIGQIGQLTAAQEAEINFSQAATAGLSKVLPGLIGGAGTGALIGGVAGGGVGSTITAPAGATIGAIGGAATGFLSGIMGNIKEQQRGELQAARIEITNARTNMRQLAMLATQDPSNADIYISMYNEQLTRVHQARRQTQAEVQGDLNAFMEDGREQLANFDSFLMDGGIADVYGQKLAIALSSGTPLSFKGDELLGDLNE